MKRTNLKPYSVSSKELRLGKIQRVGGDMNVQLYFENDKYHVKLIIYDIVKSHKSFDLCDEAREVFSLLKRKIKPNIK